MSVTNMPPQNFITRTFNREDIEDNAGDDSDEIQRLYSLLFRLYNLCAIMRFEADAGQPHPFKVGVWDKLMAEVNAELQQYTP
jgi:hypothetical protein